MQSIDDYVLKYPKKREFYLFSQLQSQFATFDNVETVIVNDLTGSLLLTGPTITKENVIDFANNKELFIVQSKTKAIKASLPKPLTEIVTAPIGQVNSAIKEESRNDVDLAGLFFLGLMSIGIYQVIRGNVMLPSWHTAFWYSLGIYSSLLKPSKA
ncbi:MAG: hypothetical protein OMM_06428 [Candidatus Magnetoglobus multicellularis str. Araruama]|uniref:Uncharacterized protein n=1 Tax=Candidatus Magnetoglobus multicellularis str. Araruama TaxID=890399 RepID=A0A1V1PHM7_9BACT|nr:MAG: hypothetical protein OMM_06428 [Candidatus Magnetoglobus multicellularis str. Araruama]